MSFPTDLDNLTNPVAGDYMDLVPHATQHAVANNAIETLQVKVGVDGSAVVTSLDYKVSQLENNATMNADTSLAGNGYFLDEDTLTSDDATKVASQQSIKAYIDAQIAGITVDLSDAHPVGCIYTNITGVNPATELGFGTWTSFGGGRVLVGLDSGDADFDTAEDETGNKTEASASHTHTGASHRHTISHTHNHDHAIGIALEGGGLFWRAADPFGTTGSFTPTDYANTGTPAGTSAYSLTNDDATGASTSYAGYATPGTGGATAPSATSVVQPSIVVYFWKRTA